jgi:hypothetical protein
MCVGGDCAEMSDRVDWWDSVNSVINFIFVTDIAFFFLRSFDFCVICTCLAKSNAALFGFMEEIFVTEWVTGGF